jgi:hypothetical protein
MRDLALVAVSALLALACAGPRPHHVVERAAGYGRPEPDPSCRSAVVACLSVNNLEQVTVRVAVSREGDLSLVDVLTPELTPAAALEVRRAFESCRWKPAVGPDGERTDATVTLAIQR